MKLITEGLLDKVTDQAKENSRLRMNYNFHDSMDAPIHVECFGAGNLLAATSS